MANASSKISLLQRGAWWALVVGVLLLLIKGFAYRLTGSAAVLSDALESIVNVLTAGVALAVIRFARTPADREHPYGHGKAEFVSAAFEGGLVFFAAIAILLESIRELIRGPELQALDAGFALMILAAVVNLGLGLHLRRVAKRGRSQALMASSTHIMSDVKTTIGVGLGLLLVKGTGWVWLDPLAAILVALHLGWEGWGILRGSFGGLLDEMDRNSLEALAQAIQGADRRGIIEIHHLRTIRSGSFHHIDAHLVVPEFWDVRTAHQAGEGFEREVVAAYDFDAEIAFHLDPCARNYCASCDLPDCPIRNAPFERAKSFNVAELIRRP